MAKAKTKTVAPMLEGKELLRAVVNHIITHPQDWNQTTWHCGTSHCVGGWCQLKAGLPQDADTAGKDATRLLGISEDDANYLFAGSRRLTEIYAFAKSFIAGEKPFDRAGFDRAGFDRDGFDRAGFDRDGFDRAGFDRAGFDRAGFDRAGFDRAGFDRAGFDRDGKGLPLL